MGGAATGYTGYTYHTYFWLGLQGGTWHLDTFFRLSVFSNIFVLHPHINVSSISHTTHISFTTLLPDITVFNGFQVAFTVAYVPEIWGSNGDFVLKYGFTSAYLRCHNLRLPEAVDMAQNRPLWRLLSMTGAM